MDTRRKAPTRARVLIVDDNDVVRRLLSGIVRQDEGLEYVGEASRGDSALELIRAKQPHVVCLDVMMPGIDGLTVLEGLQEACPGSKAVIITGYATAELIAKARELGAAGFVVKPFNAARVLSVLHSAFAQGAES